MIKNKGLIVDFNLGISPYIKRKDKAYHLIECENSLGNKFAFASEVDWLTKGRKKRLEKVIEEVKYPLTELEQKTLLNHVEVVSAAKKRKTLTYEQYDKIFKLIGVYFRLGLINLPFRQRRDLIAGYCFIYQLKVVASKFNKEDTSFICGLAAQGYQINDILKDFPERNYQDIYRLLKQQGISEISVKKKQISWSNEDIENLKIALSKNMTFKEIHENLMPKRSEASIKAYAYHLGLIKRV